MDYDDFEKLNEERKRKNFDKFRDAFDKEMRSRGDPRTLEDLFGGKKAAGPTAAGPTAAGPSLERQQLEAILQELRQETTDDSLQDIILRGLSVYRSIVRHVKAGGTVKFVAEDGTEKTLKVRLR